MKKLINITSFLIIVGIGYLWFSPKVEAQCNGVFPPNTLCGNLGVTPAPPAAFSATTSVIGPGSSTIGDLAVWANTTGNQLKDGANTIIPSNYAFSGTVSFTNTAPANITAGTSGSMIMTGGIAQQQAGSSVTKTNSDFAYNVIRIVADNTNAGVGPGNSEFGLFIENDVSGTNNLGQKYAMRGVVDLGSASTSGTSGDVVGVSGWAISAVPNGGTPSAAKGTLYGLESVAHAFSGATSYNVVGGIELDAIISAGANAQNRWGVSVVGLDVGKGLSTDAAYELGAESTGAFNTAFLVDAAHGAFGLNTNSCFICTDGTTATIAKFTDFGTITVTGNIFNFPNFTLTGAGSYIANGTLQSAGVFSTGVNGIGYKIGTMTGGTITQLTSRTTGVTLNTPSGAITLVSAAGTSAVTTFPLNNTAIASIDTLIVNQKSGTDKYLVFVTGVGTGVASLSVIDETGTTTEQPVFNYNVIKGSNN